MALFAGRTLSHVRSWRTGLSLWEASVTTGHVGPRGWYNLALMRLDADHTDGAREATETAIALGLDEPQCQALIAMAAFNGGDPAESERVARAALDRWPDHPELLQIVGVNLAQRGAWRELEALCEKPLEREPAQPVVWNLLAQARRNLGNRSGAQEALRRAQELSHP
ncbi:tetratricopeptide repeat protein [Candidatus Sumerlaeota bacterium]|nr:tetratricopeptide repeat protein [Candidatus Sumerlaeota bacterium]